MESASPPPWPSPFDSFALPSLGTSLLLTILLIVGLAAVGASIGLRDAYVAALVRIFEWGARQMASTARLARKRREEEEKGGGLASDAEEDEEDHADGESADNSMAGRSRGDSGTASESADTTTTAGTASPPTISPTPTATLRRRYGSGNYIIDRDALAPPAAGCGDELLDTMQVSSRGWAAIHDSVDFVRSGIEAIIEDEVTSRFAAEQLATWNMLTRTSTRFYRFINWKLSALYSGGVIFRYGVMLPWRVGLFVVGLGALVSSTAVVGLFPEGQRKRRLNEWATVACHRILSRAISAVVVFHDTQWRARGGGIAVANHTSPLDVTILSTDAPYALIGQRQGGILGIIQRALGRATSHIWFEREEAGDRAAVSRMLRSHVSDSSKLPILIFPEGTCINNTGVMMFKKGSFEVDAPIFPIAMKYDSRFGDPFWNSSEQSWAEYMLRMMTSWAIICNVWYLPPMTRSAGETASSFASRVKRSIAARGGLVDLDWDGQLKRTRVPPKLVAEQQERYYTTRLARYASTSDGADAAANGREDKGGDMAGEAIPEAEDEGISSPILLSGDTSLEEHRSEEEDEMWNDEEDMDKKPLELTRDGHTPVPIAN